MRIRESCRCGATFEAEDSLAVGLRYQDRSGIGYAADLVERWRTQHKCSIQVSNPETPVLPE